MKNELRRFEQRILLFSVFFLSLCGITYELVLGSLATYLLGNPVQQYSITIGFFLSSMGLGSYLSRYLTKNILKNFIMIEVALGFVGGLSVLVLSYLFSFSASYYMLHIFFLVLIGTLVGLEIPIVTRILRKYGALKDILSNVLSLDYIGGLAGSLLFPLLLFPFLGRMLTSIIIGALNIGVAMIIIVKIDYENKRKSDFVIPIIIMIILAALAASSDQINTILQKRLYYDDIVFSKRSHYQEIVLTRNDEDFRLYLDGSLQFSSVDEYRYHEMLVFPPLSLNRAPDKRVLVLGGGDGLAVREIIKCGDVAAVTLVELDPAMIDLAKKNSSLKRLNGNSLLDPRVTVVVGDAYAYLIGNKKKYDVIIADFPDPHDETITKLYTVEFYSLLRRSLARGGVFVTQSTSPLFARDAFWCIHNTMQKVFSSVVAYHVYVPSFGDWGFNMACDGVCDAAMAAEVTPGLKYYSPETFGQSLHFPRDAAVSRTEINTFNRPVLYSYYLKGWKYYMEM
ncbi:MAG: polyamine aminopropyltransferase [Spirochaetes bacterium]|nr:polyamine aminopropyltransferase [Spirochaetota bacterium]